MLLWTTGRPSPPTRRKVSASCWFDDEGWDVSVELLKTVPFFMRHLFHLGAKCSSEQTVRMLKVINH